MAATNKMRQPADYSGEGPVSSMELQVAWDLVAAIAIILIIACGLLG